MPNLETLILDIKNIKRIIFASIVPDLENVKHLITKGYDYDSLYIAVDLINKGLIKKHKLLTATLYIEYVDEELYF